MKIPTKQQMDAMVRAFHHPDSPIGEEEWRRRVSERTRAALADRKARGVRLGPPRRTPQEIVDHVVAERDAGRSWAAIAKGLELDGVATVRGGTWRVSTVQRIYQGHQLDEAARSLRT